MLIHRTDGDGEQNDPIWTAADATDLDLAAAPNGGSRRRAADRVSPLWVTGA